MLAAGELEGPFEWVLLFRYEGQRILVEDVSYTFYQDKGWTLAKKD